jgi:adenine-specific DNA-methyltransferase
LNLNKADGGNRKFILIEMKDYAETITAERIKRVINGYADKEGTGGDFAYYELGEAFFDENRNLNENLSTSQIEEYIWYSETKQNLIRSENYKKTPFFLEKYQETAYFFIYEKDKLTTLDYDFLGTVQIKAEQYVMYADNCTLPPEFCRAKNIIFKKIPRDISRL